MITEAILTPSVAQVWKWLAEVPDPEIPVVSVVDLGIVRDVSYHGDIMQVKITPTYSGCPATGIIALDIETALLKKGVEQVDVQSVLSPAWTTAWISEGGRRKLLEYGIVPPVEGDNCAGMVSLTGAKQPKFNCPLCHSNDVERISQFGSTPCKSVYRCKTCLEPFDYFKAF